MAEKTEKTEVKEVKENKFKKLLTLEPIFINKLAPKFKPVIKPIYYVLSVILAFALLVTLFSALQLGFANTLISVLLICLDFIVVRMFAEYVSNG